MSSIEANIRSEIKFHERWMKRTIFHMGVSTVLIGMCAFALMTTTKPYLRSLNWFLLSCNLFNFSVLYLANRRSEREFTKCHKHLERLLKDGS